MSGFDDNDDGALPTDALLSDGHPVAGLPTTLVVAGLEEQLSRASEGYTTTDYLSPILDAAALLRERYSGDPDSRSALDASVRRILARTVERMQAEWGVDFSELGLDVDGDPTVIVELYRLLVCDRLQNARDLLEQVVTASRKRIVERYRKGVEKRNQTVSEARRVFAHFDDVVMWVSMSQILADLKNEPDWGFDIAESVVLLEATGSVLGVLASNWTCPEFASAYCAPALAEANISVTEMQLKDAWLASSPKKAAGDTTTENEKEETNVE
jgi:hypothetical protein